MYDGPDGIPSGSGGGLCPGRLPDPPEEVDVRQTQNTRDLAALDERDVWRIAFLRLDRILANPVDYRGRSTIPQCVQDVQEALRELQRRNGQVALFDASTARVEPLGPGSLTT